MTENLESISHSVISTSLQSHGLRSTRVICPWDSSDNNIGVGCHALLQGIVPIQGSNLSLLHCKEILFCLSYQGSPRELSRKTEKEIKGWIILAFSTMIGLRMITEVKA